MDHNMFCFQCEQTAGCTGCTSRGVCGKDAQTAQVQDRLTGALIGLARGREAAPLCRTVLPAPRPCGRTGDYDLAQLWGAQEDIRSLKSLLLFGSRGMAAYAYHAMVLGYRDESVERFLL